MFSAKLLLCFFVALLGFVNIAVAATPPACLIAVIGDQSNPNDVATICKKDSVASDIASNCGSEKSAAMTAYASVCKDAGVTVSTSVASASATKSGSASASATGSASATSGSSSTASASSGSSGSSAAASTSGATSTPAPSSDAPNKIQNVGLIALCAGLFGVSAVGLL